MILITVYIIIIMSEGIKPEVRQELRQRTIDNLLNKMVLDISVYSAIGWTTGLAVGLFFFKKAPVRNILAGMGGGYGFVANRRSLKRIA